LHFAAAVANPIATPTVRAVTGYSTSGIEAPRSWSKNFKIAFKELPAAIQAAIATREHAREVELRQMQNELADLKKRLPSDADNKEPIEEETKTMAKKEGHTKGVGPYAGGDKDSKVRRDSSGLGYPVPKDISKKVDEAWTVHDEGFSSKLPKAE